MGLCYMNKEDAVELSKYRFKKSEECLSSAKALKELGDYRGAANRTYYTIFHSIRSVLALDMVEFKRHSGNISYFRQNYVKTGIFDVELSEVLTLASEIRNSSDYDDFYVLSKEEVDVQISNAEDFNRDIDAYLKKRYKEMIG